MKALDSGNQFGASELYRNPQALAWKTYRPFCDLRPTSPNSSNEHGERVIHFNVMPIGQGFQGYLRHVGVKSVSITHGKLIRTT